VRQSSAQGAKKAAGLLSGHRLTGLLSVTVIVLVVISGVLFKVVSSTTTSCSTLFVPAFFYPGPQWTEAVDGKQVPRVLILDLTDTGAGAAPEPAFQSVVKIAKAAGITVLGYSSTQYANRPAAQVEADVRHYKAWYGVSGVFLDEASPYAAQIAYYRQIAQYIHKISPTAPIWINPGTYPARIYMTVASVVMAFEGPYTSYEHIQVPGWTFKYPASRFANTVYATSQSQWRTALRLAHSRNAGFAYITDGTGSNPYGALPAYFQSETLADAGCKG